MKKNMLVSLLLVMVLVLAACGTKDASNAGEGETQEKVYRVGIDTTYPPFEYEDKNGEYTGIDIDLIKAIAEDQNFKIDFKPMDFGGIIPAMQAGQLDVAIAGMSITDDRKKIVDFTDPYFQAGLTLVVKQGETGITSIEDLAGKKVAAKKGTTGAKFATEKAEEIGFELVQFNDSPAMFQDVANGNSDVLIEDYPVIAYAIAQSTLDLEIVGDRLNGDEYGIAVLKGKNDELLKKMNKGLANLKASGKYDEIINKYLNE
ncbi:transporter substrate-binding domain-containing protein [Bacillus cihuensis]|uniref:transporter substrate-binding domain-containing protein n=1 Tax=Bacillus cihuensis TaxID=1208599 RepID=UPI00041089D0|nr:transporter substrate-binding domain-containing protein [Bacillus cihuensis]